MDKATISMTVYFAPQFLSINPYQKQLSEALEKLGIRTEGIEGNKVFLPSAINLKSSKIVHLHWLHTYFRSPEFNKFPILRFLRFPFAILTLGKFIFGLILLKIINIKIVWTAHNLKSHETFSPLLDYLCRFIVAHLSDSIIIHCETAKNNVLERFCIKKADRVLVVNHGHYADYYQNSVSKTGARKVLGLTEDSLVFLFFGLIRPYKGVIELIESFLALDRKNFDMQLVIAGKSINDSFVEHVKSKAAKDKSIKLIPGFVPDDEIQKYMNACDVVVLPYRDVLTSGAAILAMSFARACVVPQQGCMGEVLDDSGAFLYNPEQDDGLTKALNQVVTNRAALPHMGTYNQTLAKKWTWDNIAKETLSVYLQCLR